jgi:chain length determinant protein tyrosine kinase EpsG
MRFTQHAMPVDYAGEAADDLPAPHRDIGSLMREACGLSDTQIQQIAGYQRATGMRFGEAALALRMVQRKDVVEALSRQFQYAPGCGGHPADPELVMAAEPFSEQADAFRELRSRLLLEVLGERSHCALAVVSPDIGDGKTYLAANLAVAFSQLGERTLLIDADIRTPRQHRLLGVEHSTGVSSVLAGFADTSRAVQPVAGLPGLYLLPAGGVPPNPLELLQRPALGALVREMLQRFERVVLDTPAAIRGADARVIAARCGAAIAVARRGRSRMELLDGLLTALGRSSTRIAGVVVNEH